MDVLFVLYNTDILLPIELFGSQNINNNNRDPGENVPNETLDNQNNDIFPYIVSISDKALNLDPAYINNTEMVSGGRKRKKINIKQEKRLKKNTLKYGCIHTAKVKEKICYA